MNIIYCVLITKLYILNKHHHHIHIISSFYQIIFILWTDCLMYHMIDETRNCINASQNCEHLQQETRETETERSNEHFHPSDVIVEVQWWHVSNFVCVVIICVLISFDFAHQVISISCWHDIQVIMGSIGMWSCGHVVDSIVTIQTHQLCFFMCFLNRLDIFEISEVQFMDFVGNIQSLDHSIHSQSNIDVLVSMTTHMEIAWHFFDCEWTNKSAS